MMVHDIDKYLTDIQFVQYHLHVIMKSACNGSTALVRYPNPLHSRVGQCRISALNVNYVNLHHYIMLLIILKIEI